MPARPRLWMAWLVAACLMQPCVAAVPAAPAAAQGTFTVAAPQPVPRSLRAYAQVEPMAILRVRAVAAGNLSGLHVVRGSAVAAGEVLARIEGPQQRALLTTREQALASAQAQRQSARLALQGAQELMAKRLATRQAVDGARGTLATAQAAVRTAQAELAAARALATVRAPAAGIVLARAAANGEAVSAGEILLSLQPAGQLWINASYYGADAEALHVGMSGSFQPAGAGAAIAVKIATIAPALASDGGREIGLVPALAARPAWWASGQWGVLTLTGPATEMVAVPTRALILDRGHWWVLVHTAQGATPRQVLPGPAQGWHTWIASGLRAGEQVVVENAFLAYHRGIDGAFQAPD